VKCTAVQLELPAYLRAELAPSEMAAIHDHVVACSSCSRSLEELRDVTRLVADLPLGYELPAGLAERTFERLGLEVEAGSLHATEMHDPPGDLEERAFARVVSAPLGGRDRAKTVGVLVVTGAAVALAVLGFRWRSEADSLRDRLQVSVARQGPVGHSVDLMTLEGPTVEMTAELVHFRHDNYRLVLHADDLPPCRKGYHYEVWLGGDHGVVSGGTFRLERDDEIVFSSPVGVDPAEYPNVELTIEPDDGDPEKGGLSVAEAVLDMSGFDQ
jgi:hypothetical protein